MIPTTSKLRKNRFECLSKDGEPFKCLSSLSRAGASSIIFITDYVPFLYNNCIWLGSWPCVSSDYCVLLLTELVNETWGGNWTSDDDGWLPFAPLRTVGSKNMSLNRAHALWCPEDGSSVPCIAIARLQYIGLPHYYTSYSS